MHYLSRPTKEFSTTQAAQFIIECELLSINTSKNTWVKKRFVVGKIYKTDKVEYIYLTTVNNAVFRIIPGVEFTRGSSSMAKQTQILLDLRDEFPEHGDFYKRILQMFQGVLCERLKPRKLYSDTEEDAKKKMQKYEGLVLQTRKLPNQQNYVTKSSCYRITKPVKSYSELRFDHELELVSVRSLTTVLRKT